MRTYECMIKVPTVPGSKSMTTTKVRVEATDSNKAKVLLEAQYGRGNVVGSPMPV